MMSIAGTLCAALMRTLTNSHKIKTVHTSSKKPLQTLQVRNLNSLLPKRSHGSDFGHVPLRKPLFLTRHHEVSWPPAFCGSAHHRHLASFFPTEMNSPRDVVCIHSASYSFSCDRPTIDIAGLAGPSHNPIGKWALLLRRCLARFAKPPGCSERSVAPGVRGART
jgi:hypothetical protein